ncbi:immunoglobulin-like domain-containing protein [Psychromonas ossibalaenae]|uniref:immunoglobulin-like domain-containing protein n=1 Tax=Psychromonas ossibalaenae TaxID=444922 RepID=UPI0003648C6D|nr:immunoglobulin-like domain-containing protein [Psychromonas ossibalaenae]
MTFTQKVVSIALLSSAVTISVSSCASADDNSVTPFVPGQTKIENGDMTSYAGVCYIAQNNPGVWETPSPQSTWFWTETECPDALPAPEPGDVIPFIPGQTKVENGEMVSYQDECFIAKNSPGIWEIPNANSWFWDEAECPSEPPVDPKPIHSKTYTPLYRSYIDGLSIDGAYLLNDWSQTGYQNGGNIPKEIDLPVFNVNDFGANPNDGNDDLPAIQAAINKAQDNGGGIVQFKEGQYDLNIHDDGSDFSLRHAIEVSHSNIVLQGVGSGSNGTTIKQWKKANKSSELHDSVRSPHTVNFRGEYSTSRVNWLTSDIEAGDTYIPLSFLSEPVVGDSIVILMHAWEVPRVPSDNDFDLEREALYPLYSDGLDELNRPGPAYQPIKINRKIAAVHDDAIEIDIPVPRAFTVKNRAAVYIDNYTTKECGIRDVRIESIHDGSYTEGGYDTGGVQFSAVEDCWAENITIENTVLDISVNRSRNVTIRDIDVYGTIGHHSMGLYNSFNSLIEDVNNYAGRNHLLSFNTYSSGNVVRNISNLSDYNRVIGAGIDFHSGFSTFNLVENISNTKIASSGGKSGNASSGQYNVLWNVSKGNDQGEGNGLYHYCWYTSSAYNGPFEKHTDCYRRHPKMLYVGITSYDKNEQVTINNSPEDIIDEWRYIEGINNDNVYPRSLYEAQKNKDYSSYPVINGANAITISVGAEFDPLYNVTVSSERYGDITDKLVVSGEVDTQKPNTTEIEYQVIDNLGLTTTLKRRIIVN